MPPVRSHVRTNRLESGADVRESKRTNRLEPGRTARGRGAGDYSVSDKNDVSSRGELLVGQTARPSPVRSYCRSSSPLRLFPKAESIFLSPRAARFSRFRHLGKSGGKSSPATHNIAEPTTPSCPARSTQFRRDITATICGVRAGLRRVGGLIRCFIYSTVVPGTMCPLPGREGGQRFCCHHEWWELSTMTLWVVGVVHY